MSSTMAISFIELGFWITIQDQFLPPSILHFLTTKVPSFRFFCWLQGAIVDLLFPSPALTYFQEGLDESSVSSSDSSSDICARFTDTEPDGGEGAKVLSIDLELVLPTNNF